MFTKVRKAYHRSYPCLDDSEHAENTSAKFQKLCNKSRMWCKIKNENATDEDILDSVCPCSPFTFGTSILKPNAFYIANNNCKKNKLRQAASMIIIDNPYYHDLVQLKSCKKSSKKHKDTWFSFIFDETKRRKNCNKVCEGKNIAHTCAAARKNQANYRNGSVESTNRNVSVESRNSNRNEQAAENQDDERWNYINGSIHTMTPVVEEQEKKPDKAVDKTVYAITVRPVIYKTIVKAPVKKFCKCVNNPPNVSKNDSSDRATRACYCTSISSEQPKTSYKNNETVNSNETEIRVSNSTQNGNDTNSMVSKGAEIRIYKRNQNSNVSSSRGSKTTDSSNKRKRISNEGSENSSNKRPNESIEESDINSYNNDKTSLSESNIKDSSNKRKRISNEGSENSSNKRANQSIEKSDLNSYKNGKTKLSESNINGYNTRLSDISISNKRELESFLQKELTQDKQYTETLNVTEPYAEKSNIPQRKSEITIISSEREQETFSHSRNLQNKRRIEISNITEPYAELIDCSGFSFMPYQKYCAQESTTKKEAERKSDSKQRCDRLKSGNNAIDDESNSSLDEHEKDKRKRNYYIYINSDKKFTRFKSGKDCAEEDCDKERKNKKYNKARKNICSCQYYPLPLTPIPRQNPIEDLKKELKESLACAQCCPLYMCDYPPLTTNTCWNATPQNCTGICFPQCQTYYPTSCHNAWNCHPQCTYFSPLNVPCHNCACPPFLEVPTVFKDPVDECQNSANLGKCKCPNCGLEKQETAASQPETNRSAPPTQADTNIKTISNIQKAEEAQKKIKILQN